MLVVCSRGSRESLVNLCHLRTRRVIACDNRFDIACMDDTRLPQDSPGVRSLVYQVDVTSFVHTPVSHQCEGTYAT